MRVLPPIYDTPSDYDELEEVILRVFRDEIYAPLYQEARLIMNASRDENVSQALKSGRIWYSNGHFRGQFTSTLSRELRGYGAVWDRKQGTWKVPQQKLPLEIRDSISASEYLLRKKIEKMRKMLDQVTPELVAEKVQTEMIFARLMETTQARVDETLAGITVSPKLNQAQVLRIAKEYTDNLQLYIVDFTTKETSELRKEIAEIVMKGGRYESFQSAIEHSYGVSARKAKFLARQETSLLMTKFAQVRYQEAGVDEYIWKCVNGSPNHPVRPMHQIHDGKIYRWDAPPIINEKGDRKNPGQDYNCRCKARPVVKF